MFLFCKNIHLFRLSVCFFSTLLHQSLFNFVLSLLSTQFKHHCFFLLLTTYVQGHSDPEGLHARERDGSLLGHRQNAHEPRAPSQIQVRVLYYVGLLVMCIALFVVRNVGVAANFLGPFLTTILLHFFNTSTTLIFVHGFL